ncbi:unnamed protein product [Moneuplotes crassus]|uniref:Uncharacterized protein n=2 Tax=Euplotes crassus TaxID=5936 RepID=A0AAD1U6N1_EUPCR|nr:unnamed protein product [Moneuplotes crassus]
MQVNSIEDTQHGFERYKSVTKPSEHSAYKKKVVNSRIDWEKGPLVKQNKDKVSNFIRSYDSSIEDFAKGLNKSIQIKSLDDSFYFVDKVKDKNTVQNICERAGKIKMKDLKELNKSFVSIKLNTSKLKNHSKRNKTQTEYESEADAEVCKESPVIDQKEGKVKFVNDDLQYDDMLQTQKVFKVIVSKNPSQEERSEYGSATDNISQKNHIHKNDCQTLRNYFEPSVKLNNMRGHPRKKSNPHKHQTTSLKYLREGQMMINDSQGILPMREISINVRKTRGSTTQERRRAQKGKINQSSQYNKYAQANINYFQKKSSTRHSMRHHRKKRASPMFGPLRNKTIQDMKSTHYHKNSPMMVNYDIARKDTLPDTGDKQRYNIKASVSIKTPHKSTGGSFLGMGDNSVSPTRSIYNKKDKIVKSAKIYSKEFSKISMLLSKRSVHAMNKRLRENVATQDIYAMLQKRRKEIRREYQNKKLILRDPNDEEYATQEILGYAMSIMTGVKEKSKNLEGKMEILQKKWNLKEP